jgi:hypothetical protein
MTQTLPAEIEIDRANKDLVDRIQAALIHPLSETFKDSLDTLVRLASNVKGKARLWLDFAPLSFEFVIIRGNGVPWINGGIIFHGQHDGYGSGGAPTFSTCVNPEDGWSVHT